MSTKHVVKVVSTSNNDVSTVYNYGKNWVKKLHSHGGLDWRMSQTFLTECHREWLKPSDKQCLDNINADTKYPWRFILSYEHKHLQIALCF